MDERDFLNRLKADPRQDTAELADAATVLQNTREATERPQFQELAEYVLEKQAVSMDTTNRVIEELDRRLARTGDTDQRIMDRINTAYGHQERKVRSGISSPSGHHQDPAPRGVPQWRLNRRGVVKVIKPPMSTAAKIGLGAGIGGLATGGAFGLAHLIQKHKEKKSRPFVGSVTKTATAGQVVRDALYSAGRAIAPAAPLMIAGALLGGTSGYLTSRRSKKTGVSKSEDLTGAISERLDRTPRERKGFIRNLAADSARATSDVAHTFSDHPTKAGLISAGLGALIGLTTARLAGYKRS